MGMLDAVLQSVGSGGLRQLGAQFGLDTADVEKVLGQVVPALSGGLGRNARSADGMAALQSALQRGGHQRYVSDPSAVTSQAGIEEGNAILGHILGSKDVSRKVAASASASSGVSSDAIKGMLPMAATLLMGTLSQRSTAGAQAAPSAQGGGIAEMLGSFLDADKDGSALDDVMDMAKKLF